ncbi:MAG: hypothetical protein II393_01270 [Cytophagales bacterium]|nr:hypothetical protein [Cytophagales bacterium]
MFLILISVMLYVDNYGRCCPCNKKNKNTFPNSIPQSDEKTLNGFSQKSFKPESYKQDINDKKKKNLNTETIKSKTEMDISQYQDETGIHSYKGLELKGINTFIESIGEYTLSKKQKQEIEEVVKKIVNGEMKTHIFETLVVNKENNNIEKTMLKFIFTKHKDKDKFNVHYVATSQKGVIFNQKK